MKKPKHKHAALRLFERYSGDVTIWQLEDIVEQRKYESLKRSTNTRTICRAVNDDGKEVYFVLDRKAKPQRIVTVLTPEQARGLLMSLSLASGLRRW